MKIFIALLIIGLVAAAPVPWTNCGGAGDKISVTSLDANPWPPVKGKDLTVTVGGSALEDIPAGTYNVKVSYIGIPLLNKSGDICTLDPKLPCPIKKGPISMSESATIPGSAPGGAYKVELDAKDAASNRLICAKLEFHL